MGFVVAILVSLPPQKACYFVFGCIRVILAQVLEHVLGPGDVAQVLESGMPSVLGRSRYFALGPACVTDFVVVSGGDKSDLLSCLLVGGLDFVPGAAGGKEIPPEATVSDRAFEDKHGFVQSITELVSDSGLYADLAA